MFARFLLFLGILTAAAGIGSSQPAGDYRLPDPCRATAAEGLPALQKRKQRLERDIARSGARDKADAKTLTKSQEELLGVLFQIECLEVRQTASEVARPLASAPEPKAAPPETAPGPAPPPVATARPRPAPPTRAVAKPGSAEEKATAKNVVEVTTYYATNRGRSGRSEPAQVYDAEIAPLTYGRALVTIPSAHTPGSLELPSIWRLELRPDPAKHFVLKAVAALDMDKARAEMARTLASSGSKALLVFVHGYNMSFAETAMRTAQLAYDLNFPGMPFFFSWPSAAQITGYLRDLETAQLSEDAFDRVLDDLSQLPASELYIVAHSMGSRLVSQVLKSRVDRGKPTARLRELLLAAPDINAELFRTAIAPRLQALQGTQTTVYASSSDLALKASKAVHGYRRVGETDGGVFVYPGLETIDASGASMAVRAFGHSYLTDSAAVLKDVQALLRKRLPARQRGLAEAGISPNIYWSLR
jgi:esterase/lipase superfamily enzyme